jgi:hypothetical protein
MSVEESTPDGPSGSVSRRTLMKTAAGAGVVAAAVGAVGTAYATPYQASMPSTPVAGIAGIAGPLVVHVTDLAGGRIDVYTDGVRTEIHDADLAHRIARAAQP